ncbi:MAG: nucleotidyltransferase domain-containing protein [Methylobacter sp.]|jgi:predicted nucleotidyltransferase|nr:nucleotidyltransferase domain-containing protein [Methylobacter sp.]
MRLSQPQVDVICASALKNFGQSARVWLFGSRIDEQSKGGDIDLYIEPELQDPAELVDAKLHFLLELHKKLGEQKIDVVIRRAEFKDDLPIFRIARETGVQLL